MATVSQQVLSQYGGPQLTYKGHGLVFKDAGSSNTTLSYGTVSGGSAPVAGDLVVWVWFVVYEAYDTSPVHDDRRKSLTGAGWVQSNVTPIIAATDTTELYTSTILAKRVSAADLASPAVLQNTLSAGTGLGSNYGLWIAYSVGGMVSSISIPTHVRNGGSSSAPASIPVDSSALNAPAEAITLTISVGTDSSITLTGITPDHEISQNNFGQYYDSTLDARIGEKKDVGGASYTVGKGDDGDPNYLIAAYVAVS